MPRIFTLHSDLGESLQFDSFDGVEELSRMFDGTLVGASLDKAIPLNALLGKSVTIEVELQDKSRRYFNAHVSEFKQIRRHGRHHRYELRLRPKAWFLSLTKDFRVYQKMSALDIVKSVYSEFGIVIKDCTTGSHPSLDYTVLYGESYLDFCLRLQEKEGIGFYFEHSMGSHTLVLFDSVNVLSTLPSHATIPYYPPDMAAIPDEEFVSAIHAGQTVNPGKFATREHDFKGPKAYLEVNQPNPRDHELNRYEIYDYPGVYRDLGQGETYGRIGIEELQVNHERCDGETNVRGFAVGYRFNLIKCARADQNREYIIEIAHYHWTDNSYETGAGSEIVEHLTHFTIRPSSEPYRPARITPHPVAYATEVAIVTGPPGEEIWTDTHGRVKVRFPWDRRGPKDQNSSCWVRVATPWAGSNFGAVHIPRIGQEVVIAYVNNNPDHPIVISRVYNGDNMPPWDLPGNATQSGILTRSTKGGGYDNANAIRFEDKKGEEQLWLHAEKDQLTEVEHDEDKWVGNDRRKTIDRDETNHIKRDRTETVDRDETITVHGKRTEVVDGNEDITIHSNRTELVNLDETITINKNRSERVDLCEKISIGVNREEDVGINEKISIGNNREKSIGKNESDNIGSNWSIKVGKLKLENIGMAMMQNIGLAKSVNIGLAYSLIVGMMRNTMVGMIDRLTVGKSRVVSIGEEQEVSIGKTEKRKIGKSRATTVGEKDVLTVGQRLVVDVGQTLILNAGTHMEFNCAGAKIVLRDGKIYFNGQELHGLMANSINLDAAMVYINDGKAKAPPAAPPEPPPEEKPASAGASGAGAAASDGANPVESGLSKLMEGGQNAFAALNQLKSLAQTAQAIKNGDLGGIAGAAGGLAGGGIKGSSASPSLGGSVGMGDGAPGNF